MKTKWMAVLVAMCFLSSFSKTAVADKALLITGGPPGDHRWDLELSSMYKLLKETYAYGPDDLIVVSDQDTCTIIGGGCSSDPEACALGQGQECRLALVLDDYSQGIEVAFNELKTRVDSSERAFVWVYVHGYRGDGNDDMHFFPQVRDFELAYWLGEVAAKAGFTVFLTNSCHAGRLQDDLGSESVEHGVQSRLVAISGTSEYECTDQCQSFSQSFAEELKTNPFLSIMELYTKIGIHPETPAEQDDQLDDSYLWFLGDEGILQGIRFAEQLGDNDEDGIRNVQDKCMGAKNPSQDDCDDNGVGDACDTDPCLDFWGLGSPVDGDRQVGTECSLVSGDFVSGIWQTRSPMPIRYKTAGQEAGTHDVQLRWCDCSKYSPDPSTTGKYFCGLGNCGKTESSQRSGYRPNFKYSGWHLASLDKDGDVEQVNGMAEDCRIGYLSVPCHRLRADCPTDGVDEAHNITWSEVQASGEQGDGPFAYHCSPEKKDYSDISVQTRYWDWQWELWWPENEGAFVEEDEDGRPVRVASRVKEPPGWGYLWLRPEMESSCSEGTEECGTTKIVVQCINGFWETVEVSTIAEPRD